MSTAWIERHWQTRTALAVALYPLSMLFRAIVAVRASLYRLGVLKTVRPPVPVVIVGNVTVGGTGKTPLVLWLAAYLRERGWHPGIVSRGYRSRVAAPRAVTPADDAVTCGDEPILLAQRSGCPVWIGADRAAVACALLAAHPQCNIIVADDGLQHYALARDFEIAVIDTQRGLGNCWLMPAGPLREPPCRLASVDAIVANGDAGGVDAEAVRRVKRPLYAMRLEGRVLCNLLNPEHRVNPSQLQHLEVHAVAGIGNPQRFFAHLQELGLNFTAHPFPDHHQYRPGDLAFETAEAIVMTEKDAVKCRAFATERHWVLPVDAVIEPALGQQVLHKLGQCDEQ